MNRNAYTCTSKSKHRPKATQSTEVHKDRLEAFFTYMTMVKLNQITTFEIILLNDSSSLYRIIKIDVI